MLENVKSEINADRLYALLTSLCENTLGCLFSGRNNDFPFVFLALKMESDTLPALAGRYGRGESDRTSKQVHVLTWIGRMNVKG